MNKHIANLIELGAMVGGRIKKVDGFVVFERLPKEELANLPENEIAYASLAMGRAVFTIDSNGKITNYKGVDSHLTNEESASKSLVQGEAVSASKDGVDYQTINFPVNLVVFPGGNKDVRIRGLSPLEDLEIEAFINFRMQGKGIKLPQIQEIKEFSQEFCERYGLPHKVDGSFEEFSADYQEENDIIKKSLPLMYPDRYHEEIIPGKRPETLGEYFRRINLGEDPAIKQFLEENNYSFDAFISYVDHDYALGQRYGQAIRLVESPFRIADIEYYTKQGNIEALNSIVSFTEESYPDRVPFENYFAKQLGTNVANMMNNGWACNNFSHRQDYSLAGEMCDDSYMYVPEKLKEAEKYRETAEGRMRADQSDKRLKFFLQTYLLSSNIKVLQDSMKLRGKSDKEIASVLDDYIESFASNLDLQKASMQVSTNPNAAKEAFALLITVPKNIQKLLAFKPTGPGKSDINEEVLLAHNGNNAFYDQVSHKLAEKLGIQRTFIPRTREEAKPVEPYSFLEDR